MPVKYNRKSEVEEAIESHRPPYGRISGRSLSSWGKRPYIPMLVFVLVLMTALIFFSPSNRNPFSGQPWLRGEGTVIQKLEREEGRSKRQYLEIAVELGGDLKSVSGYLALEPDHWARLQVGDRVGVLYQISRGGRILKLQECSLVALPVDSQVK